MKQVDDVKGFFTVPVTGHERRVARKILAGLVGVTALANWVIGFFYCWPFMLSGLVMTSAALELWRASNEGHSSEG